MRKIASDGSIDGRFVDFKEGTVAGTVLSADWLNTVQDELVAVATMNGANLLADKNDQVKSAINSLVSTVREDLLSRISTAQTKANANETRLNNRVGEIVTTLSNTPPPDCLLCNGGDYKESDYPKLIEYVNANKLWKTSVSSSGGWGHFIRPVVDRPGFFHVPNLSGLFLRMVGDNPGALGLYQSDEIKEHRHLEGAHVEFGTGDNITNQGTRNTGADPGGRRYYTSTVGGTETRPKNVAVNFWVRYQ